MIEQKHSEVWKKQPEKTSTFCQCGWFFLDIKINVSVLANTHCSSERIRTLPQQWLWKNTTTNPRRSPNISYYSVFMDTVVQHYSGICFFFFLFLHLPFCSSLNGAFLPAFQPISTPDRCGNGTHGVQVSHFHAQHVWLGHRVWLFN